MHDAVQALPGLNEYDSEAVIAAIRPQSLQKPDTPRAPHRPASCAGASECVTQA